MESLMIHTEAWFQSIANSPEVEEVFERLSHGDDEAIRDLWNLGNRGQIRSLHLTDALLARAGYPNLESFLGVENHLPENELTQAKYKRSKAILGYFQTLDRAFGQIGGWPSDLSSPQALHDKWDSLVKKFNSFLEPWSWKKT